MESRTDKVKARTEKFTELVLQLLVNQTLQSAFYEIEASKRMAIGASILRLLAQVDQRFGLHVLSIELFFFNSLGASGPYQSACVVVGGLSYRVNLFI